MPILNSTKQEILRSLADDEKTIYRVSKDMEMSYSTTYKHISSLADGGFISQNNQKWKITDAGIQLLNAMDAGINEKKKVKPKCQSTGETNQN